MAYAAVAESCDAARGGSYAHRGCGASIHAWRSLGGRMPMRDVLLTVRARGGLLLATRESWVVPAQHLHEVLGPRALRDPCTTHMGMAGPAPPVPGLGRDPATAFDTLWATRGVATIAGVPCAVPAPSDQAVLLLLHAARSPASSRPAAMSRTCGAARHLRAVTRSCPRSTVSVPTSPLR